MSSQNDDFLFRGDLDALDPDVARLIELEGERQARKLIMIPSESSSPWAVREALGSVLMNIYAEGYPNPETHWLAEEEVLDYEHHLAHYRRYGDRRYYRGVEYVDVIESLALQAVALQAQGKLDQALTALERALTLAEPEGYVRTFIDEGAPMGKLLQEAAARGAVDVGASRRYRERRRTGERRRSAGDRAGGWSRPGWGRRRRGARWRPPRSAAWCAPRSSTPPGDRPPG